MPKVRLSASNFVKKRRQVILCQMHGLQFDHVIQIRKKKRTTFNVIRPKKMKMRKGGLKNKRKANDSGFSIFKMAC